MTRPELIDRLSDLILQVHCSHPVRVAIDGIDTAGKTTLADELVETLGRSGREIIRASIDGFHNPRDIRYRRGPESPEGYYRDSFDYDALTALLLRPLGPGGCRQYQTAKFNFRADTEVQAPILSASPDAVLLFDGVFLLRTELFTYWDFRIFVDIDFETALQRASRRDQDLFGSAADVRQRYLARYIPGQRLYLAAARPADKADIVVHNNNPDNTDIRFSNRVRP